MAEGIERQDQLDILRGLSCELGQGNHLAPAMREEALVHAMLEGTDAAEVRRFAAGPVSAFIALR